VCLHTKIFRKEECSNEEGIGHFVSVLFLASLSLAAVGCSKEEPKQEAAPAVEAPANACGTGSSTGGNTGSTGSRSSGTCTGKIML